MRMLVCLSAALALGVPQAAGAYNRTLVPGSGTPITWLSSCVPFQISTATVPEMGMQEFEDTVLTSFATWETVDCSYLSFPYDGPTSSVEVGYLEGEPNENLIVYRGRSCEEVAPNEACWDPAEDCCSRFNCWCHGDLTIALTTVTFDNDGVIFDADIEINGVTFAFTNQEPAPRDMVDLENTVTHEIGHLVGLEHTSTQQATMYAEARPGEVVKRDLHSDDVAGICAIYPLANDPDVCPPVPPSNGDDNGCGCALQGPRPSPLGLALPTLALLGLVMALRRRRD